MTGIWGCCRLLVMGSWCWLSLAQHSDTIEGRLNRYIALVPGNSLIRLLRGRMHQSVPVICCFSAASWFGEAPFKTHVNSSRLHMTRSSAYGQKLARPWLVDIFNLCLPPQLQPLPTNLTIKTCLLQRKDGPSKTSEMRLTSPKMWETIYGRCSCWGKRRGPQG